MSFSKSSKISKSKKNLSANFYKQLAQRKMAEKRSKGKRQKIDEDNDVFLSFINKKKRNNKKKLTEIEELEKRDPSTLKPEQIAKIKSKQEVVKQNNYWHEIKDLYYQALKSNLEEGGKKQTVAKETSPLKEKTAPVHKETSTEPHKEQVSKSPYEVIKPIISLIHINDFFGYPEIKEEFDKNYVNLSGSLGFTSTPDFKAIQEFSNKVFKVAGPDVSYTTGKKLEAAIHHVERYLEAANELAAADKTYSYIADTVNKLVSSEFFREHKVVLEPKEVTIHQPREEEGVKSSPLETKKEEPSVKYAQENLRAPQEKTEDWAEMEEEKEEEYEKGHESDDEQTEEDKKKQPEAEVQKKPAGKPEDEFVEVKAKHLEKKKQPEDTGRRGGGRRGRGERRGGDGGRRGERRGEGGDREKRGGGYPRRGEGKPQYVVKQEEKPTQKP